jgi:hypothetical protein
MYPLAPKLIWAINVRQMTLDDDWIRAIDICGFCVDTGCDGRWGENGAGYVLLRKCQICIVFVVYTHSAKLSIANTIY